MPLSKTSRNILAGCEVPIVRFVMAISEGVDKGDLRPLVDDITVLCGYRSQKEQDDAYKRGTSKLQWPNSKHNKSPSLAVDIAPYPIDWNDLKAFGALRTYARGVARGMGIGIRIIDWDWPHFELVV